MAKITKFNLAIVINENVLWFKVSIKISLSVHMSDSECNLEPYGYFLLFGQYLALLASIMHSFNLVLSFDQVVECSICAVIHS